MTRGYTEELWEMTTLCWREDPSDRPTVDHVLAALRSAAEEWKPKHRAPGTLSPALTETPDGGTGPNPEEEAEVRELIEAFEVVSRKDLPPAYRCIRPAHDSYWGSTTK